MSLTDSVIKRGSEEDRLDIIAILAALSMFLAALEYCIPKPVPFMRLGLANLSLLIGLGLLNYKNYVMLLLTKVFVQGLITGSLFSYVILFSFLGTLGAGSFMYLLKVIFKEHISLVGVSIMGALVNNLIQLALAGLIVFGPGVLFLGPPFILVGLCSSIFLGLFANKFVEKSKWIRKVSKSCL